MSNILELNIKAKAFHPPPPPQIKLGKVVIQPGKKYVTNDGTVVGPVIQESKHLKYITIFLLDKSGWFTADGKYCGNEHIEEAPEHLKHEWFKTYKEFDAWVEGKKIQSNGESIYRYSLIRGALGSHERALRWWLDNIDYSTVKVMV